MTTILKMVADYARARVERDRNQRSLALLRELCHAGGKADGRSFELALNKPEISFICEIKKASPSKGIISEGFPYLNIAVEYAAAGADCISCLTEPGWFLGSDEIFRQVRSAVPTPMLRKDFVVDEYQLYQAKLLGANAVLLICALLEGPAIADYLKICGELGMAAVVEAHDEMEIAGALASGARIIGVNNRSLKDFSVDIGNCFRLRSLVPHDVLFIAESGIRTPEDIQMLRREGVDAVLIGETLMRAADKGAALRLLRGENREEG